MRRRDGDEYSGTARDGWAAAALVLTITVALLVLACRGLLQPATIEDLLWLGGAR